MANFSEQAFKKMKTDESVERDVKQEYLTRHGFGESSEKWDLILIVEGVPIHVCRVILEMCSPVFDKMIRDSNKDDKDKKAEISVPDTKYEDFVNFLSCFYPGKSHQLNDSTVFHILPLACTYAENQVKEQCEQYLRKIVESERSSRSLIAECIDAAYSCDLNQLKYKFIRRMVNMELEDGKTYMSGKIFPKNMAAKLDVYEQLIPSLKRVNKSLESTVDWQKKEIERLQNRK